MNKNILSFTKMKNASDKPLRITYFKNKYTVFSKIGWFITIIILLCVASLNVHSQITLNYSNFLVPPSATSSFQGAVTKGVAVPPAGANQTWDYKNLMNNSFYSIREFIPEINAAFPNSRRQIVASDYRFFAGFSTTIYQHESNSNSALKFIGATTNRTAYSLAFKTGVSTDSLILLSQNIFYGGSKIAIPYPCTYQSTWVLGEYIVYNMQISLASEKLDHASLTFVSSTLNNRSIIGWGRMRVPVATNYIPCLMMKIQRTETDSFYVNGLPADTAVLNVLDVMQGQVSHIYQYSFRRKGIEQDLMIFTMDSSYNKIQKIIYDDKHDNIECGKNAVTMCLNGQNVCKAYKNNEANHAMLNHGASIGNCTTTSFSALSLTKP